jgi:hypothetical protein
MHKKGVTDYVLLMIIIIVISLVIVIFYLVIFSPGALGKLIPPLPNPFG